ncbi:hypothetical protein T265_13857, partial [Opisthorchis viverrini]
EEISFKRSRLQRSQQAGSESEDSNESAGEQDFLDLPTSEVPEEHRAEWEKFFGHADANNEYISQLQKNLEDAKLKVGEYIRTLGPFHHDYTSHTGESDRRVTLCYLMSAYSPTDCSSEVEKDTFYRELSGLIRQAKCTDIVILAGDMNAQVGRMGSLESHSGGRFGVDARRTDNGDRLLQLCADHELFLASTTFQYKRSHRLTWRPPTANQPWTQLDHVAISHRWRATIQDCRSFWGTPLDSNHAMVFARPTVRFPSGPRKSARSMPIHCLRRTTVPQQCRSELAQQLSTVNQYCGGSERVDEAWQNVKGAILAAFSASCPTSPIRPQDHWMSSRSLSMIDARKAIPAGNDFYENYLLPKVKQDIEENRRLSVHMFEALIASMFRAEEFVSGVFLPWIQSDMSKTEGVILAHLIKKATLKSRFAAVALALTLEEDFSIPRSLVIEALLSKRYNMPEAALSRVIQYFLSFDKDCTAYYSDENRMPVTWFRTLLLFLEFYRHCVRPDDRTSLIKLCRRHEHPQVTAEIRALLSLVPNTSSAV